MEREGFARVRQAGHMIRAARMLETMPYPLMLTEPERQAMALMQLQIRAIARRIYQVEERVRELRESEENLEVKNDRIM